MAIVGVMGSGSEEWEEFAAPLGAWLATTGHELLTGAGKGVMFSVARAFAGTAGRTGRSIGIVPTRADALLGFVPLAGYPNPFIDLPILTPLPRKEASAPSESLSRNHVNVLTSDIVIALPGGPGTLDEIRLALRYAKPVMCLGPDEAFASAPPAVNRTTRLDDVFRFITKHAALKSLRRAPAG